MIEDDKHMNKSLASLTLAALVMPSAFAQSQPTLSWEHEGQADGFRVYASPESGKYVDPIGTTTNKTFQTSRLPLGKWFFTVTAFNAAGESEKSEEVSTVTLAAPTNLRLESGTNYMFPMKLTWDKSASSTVFGDVKYRVYRRNRFPETSTWFPITETMNTFYSAQVLQAGQFVYRVSTLKSGFESPFSSNDIFVRVGLAARQE